MDAVVPAVSAAVTEKIKRGHEGIAPSKKHPFSLREVRPVHANVHPRGQSSTRVPERSPQVQQQRAAFAGASVVFKGAAGARSKALQESGMSQDSPFFNIAADM